MAPRSRAAKDMAAQDPRFLWRDRLPVGHITVLAGAPAKGKSTLGYHLAADADVPAIFVTTEEADRSVWRPRLEAAGMDLGKAWHHGEVRFSKNPEDLAYLGSLIDDYKAELVIVDPLSNHMRGASIHRDEQVRDVFEPYLKLIDEKDVALLLHMHVLRSVDPNKHPQSVIPAGVLSIAKAIYLFSEEPGHDSDPNYRILACPDKFNFGPPPGSLRFEYNTKPVTVRDKITGTRRKRDYGYWTFSGESTVTARALLVTLAPETKDRKADRAGRFLIEQLKDGPVPGARVLAAGTQAEPPIAPRTLQRVAHDMSIVITDDEHDSRVKLWALPPEYLEVLEEAGSIDDVIIQEVDLPEVPDTLPEDWTGEEPTDEDGDAA